MKNRNLWILILFACYVNVHGADDELDINYNVVGYRIDNPVNVAEDKLTHTTFYRRSIISVGMSWNPDAITANTCVITLLRTREDGTPANGFTGTAILSPGPLPLSNYDLCHPAGVTVQRDGKILVAAATGTYDDDSRDFALLRLNLNGTPDTTFGANGLVRVDITGRRQKDMPSDLAIIKFQGEELILVSGTTQTRENGQEVAVVAYRLDGSLEKRFGINGMAILGFEDNVRNDDYVIGMKVNSKNEVFILGNSQSIDTNIHKVAWINLDERGRVLVKKRLNEIRGIHRPYSFDIDNEDNVLIAVDFDGAPALFKVHNGEKLDRGFGSDGVLVLPVGAWGGDGLDPITDLEVLENGKIFYSTRDFNQSQNYRVTRLNSDGSIDTSFTSGDSLEIDIPALNGGAYSENIVYDISEQADGKIVLTGSQLEENIGFSTLVMRVGR